MGSEFKAIILSTWRIPCTLPGKVCPLCFCMFLSLLFQCRWSVCSVHFNGLSSLVLVMKDAVVKETTHIHASVLLAFQHMECLLFDILLYLLLLLKNAMTYGLVFVYGV